MLRPQVLLGCLILAPFNIISVVQLKIPELVRPVNIWLPRTINATAMAVQLPLEQSVQLKVTTSFLPDFCLNFKHIVLEQILKLLDRVMSSMMELPMMARNGELVAVHLHHMDLVAFFMQITIVRLAMMATVWLEIALDVLALALIQMSTVDPINVSASITRLLLQGGSINMSRNGKFQMLKMRNSSANFNLSG